MPTAKRTIAKEVKPVTAKTIVKALNMARIETNQSLPVILNNATAFYAPQSGTKYWPFLHPEDNLFMKFLQLRLLSVTQSNCINDKTLYSVGEGLIVKGDKGTIAEFPTNFDKKINAKGQNIDTVLKAVFESFFQDGNKFIEISRVTIGSDKFVYCYPHNNLDCRFAYDDDQLDPIAVIRSREFRKDGIYNFGKDNKAITIPIWSDGEIDPNSVWMKDINGVERTMLVVKNEIQGVEPYGLPSNFAGMIQALSEYKAGRFNLDNFDNGMFIAGVLSIVGSISKEEEKNITRGIRNMFTGEGKNSRILPISSEGGDLETKFTPFQQTHEGHFVEFDKHNEGKIVNANNWSKELLDMQDTVGLGKGGSYLAQLFQRKFKTAIRPVQRVILDNFIFPLMKIKDEFQGSEFYKLQWDIKPVVPVSLEGDLDLNSLLTVDEGRDEIGLGPHKDPTIGGKQISQIAAKPGVVAPDPNTNTVPPIPKK